MKCARIYDRSTIDRVIDRMIEPVGRPFARNAFFALSYDSDATWSHTRKRESNISLHSRMRESPKKTQKKKAQYLQWSRGHIR